jgi:hypothetical protein
MIRLSCKIKCALSLRAALDVFSLGNCDAVLAASLMLGWTCQNRYGDLLGIFLMRVWKLIQRVVQNLRRLQTEQLRYIESYVAQSMAD